LRRPRQLEIAMDDVRRLRPSTFRSIFISDVHLGFKGCQAELLLDFLRSTRCQYLYLIGDIIDVWNMRNGLYWPQSHNDVIRTILGKAKHGTRVIFIPGNHDEIFREYDGVRFGNLSIHNKYIHVTADERRLLLLHGDEFDSVVQKRLGYRYWSLAAFLKHKVKNAVSYIGNFETAVARSARKHRVDGLVCGHIHRPEIREIEGILYCNDGDWVESCSALVEHRDGRLELLDWDAVSAAPAESQPVDAAA
jgi:UDP-2,3-diacylglucosamine pyrophosphatase LpxH